MILLRVLAWLGLPAWVAPLLMAAVFASGVGGAYVKGRMDSAANCREAALQAQIRAMERDNAIAKSIEEQAVKRTAEMVAETNRLQKEVDVYEAALQRRSDRCDLTATDIKSLDRMRRKRP